MRVILGVEFNIEDAIFESTQQINRQPWPDERVVGDRLVKFGRRLGEHLDLHGRVSE